MEDTPTSVLLFAKIMYCLRARARACAKVIIRTLLARLAGLFFSCARSGAGLCVGQFCSAAHFENHKQTLACSIDCKSACL